MTVIQSRQYLVISLVTLVIGMLFYGLYNELIIIRLPSKKGGSIIEHSTSQRKTTKLIYWNNSSFVTEEKGVLISTDLTTTLYNLIMSWLTLLEEENPRQKKVSVQSIMLDKTGTELFLSFDRNPLTKELSTYQKLCWIEGLLRTLALQNLPIKTVQFLVHHKPLNDPHLDFSHAWPITGYLKR